MNIVTKDRVKMNTGINDKVFYFVGYLISFIMVIVCIYPFYYLLIISVSSTESIQKGIVMFYPMGLTINNYIEVFKLEGIARATFVSMARTVLSTGLSIYFTSMLAFVLSRNNFSGRKILYRLTIITMYATGGLIPKVVTMKYLGLTNTFWLYVFPYIIIPFHMVLVKTYMESIPVSLDESARLDGAGDFRIFNSIMLPLSKPIIAAIAVFGSVMQWNMWQDNFFMVPDPRLRTLQFMLMKFLKETEMLIQVMSSDIGLASDIMKEPGNLISPFGIKTTITMVVTIPIFCVYPFMQKYFVKGIMIGAVKG